MQTRRQLGKEKIMRMPNAKMVSLAVLTLISAVATSSGAAAAKPHVVFFLVDDWGHANVSC